MLKYKPAPIKENRERFAACLRDVFDVESIAQSGAKRPGECPENVFDFEDGLRLIVSRERMPNGRIITHVSASPQPGSDLYKSVKEGQTHRESFCAIVSLRYADLSKTHDDLELVGWSEKGIPHFRVVTAVECAEMIKNQGD